MAYKNKQNKWLDPMFRSKVRSAIGNKEFDKIVRKMVNR